MAANWNLRRVAVASAVAVGGCTQSHAIRPLRPLELATAPYLDRLVEARTGSLMYEGGCLLFRDDGTTQRFLPVWPTGTVFNGTSVIFHQPAKDEQRIIVGEEFVMGGQRASWPTLAAGYLPFRQQCGGQPFFVSSVRPAD